MSEVGIERVEACEHGEWNPHESVDSTYTTKVELGGTVKTFCRGASRTLLDFPSPEAVEAAKDAILLSMYPTKPQLREPKWINDNFRKAAQAALAAAFETLVGTE